MTRVMAVADAAAEPLARGIFRQPFDEQVAFFRSKLGRLLPTQRWDDVWKTQHDRGFMVAGAMRADLLSDLAGAVDQAIAGGQSIDWFRAHFDEIVARHGWDYKGERNWRTRTIYGANMRTSYSAGRVAQLRDGEFPFWMYKHGGSLDPRPEHLALDGITLPADHRFWRTYTAPNGWGCSCRIVGLRRLEDARRLGGDPGKPLPEGWDSIDPATGEPPGIDRGWGYAPGDAAYHAQVAAGQFTRWSDSVARDVWLEWAQRLDVDTLDRVFDRLGSTINPDRRAGMVRAAAERYVDLVMANKTVRGLDLMPAPNVGGAGVDLGGRWLALDASMTRHAMQHHGTDRERRRGQVPIVARDLANLDLILRSGTLRPTDGRGQLQRLKLGGAVAMGHRYEAIFELRRGRMALVTIYKWPETENP